MSIVDPSESNVTLITISHINSHEKHCVPNITQFWTLVNQISGAKIKLKLKLLPKAPNINININIDHVHESR